MTLSITAEPIPLEMNADSVVQVGRKRVTLDTVIAIFNSGATAKEICLVYPSFQLADVYVVISYYLRHHQKVEVYLQQRQKRPNEIRKQNEAKFNLQGVRVSEAAR